MMKQIKSRFILILLIVVSSCVTNKSITNNKHETSKTDCSCDSLWSKPAAKDFVSFLEKSTVSDYPVWKGYNLGDATFILNAGSVNDTTHCLGIWKKGESISYKCSRDIPKMLTPLYSYYLNYSDIQKMDSAYFETHKKAPEFSSWMKKNGIEAAVYMPTEFPKFPFEISAKVKVQLAVHEAFHIEVMLRSWYTNKGFWPKWDRQPDRAGVLSCYTENALVEKLIKDEQETQVLLIEALLDHRRQDAILNGNKFLEIREARYNALKGMQIKLEGNVYGDCRTAESLMEIEEGIADYASWVKMFDIGVISRSDLLKRYRAEQKEKFYLTGCMLLHASVLMNKGNDPEIISKIVNSNSVEDGNLLSIFKEQLVQYSKN